MKKLREREVGHIVQDHREATSAAVLKGRRSRTPTPAPAPALTLQSVIHWPPAPPCNNSLRSLFCTSWREPKAHQLSTKRDVTPWGTYQNLKHWGGWGGRFESFLFLKGGKDIEKPLSSLSLHCAEKKTEAQSR